MITKHVRAIAALGACAAAAVLAIQAVPAAQEQQRQTPTISRTIELVRSDVIVRDSRGQFVPDLKKEEFVISEDGVLQEIATMVLSNGGRIYNIAAPPPVQAPEGIILPQTRPPADTSGRIFIIFIDDQHLDFRNTGRIRDLLRRIAKQLIHEGDMFGIVSSGPSSIAVDLTYDRNRLEEAIKKTSGNGLKPEEIMQAPEGVQGPSEIRHRAHVAFSTVNDILQKLEKVTDRRKAFIYVSNGYDFNPFPDYRMTDDREWSESMRNGKSLGETAAVVGQIDRDRRGPGRHDAEHVPFVHQLVGDFLEEIADAAGVAEVEVQVVDENQEDAARRVRRRARRRQQNAFGHRRRRRRRDVVAAAAVGQRERDELLGDAVLQHLEIVFLQVGDELAAVVADDHVGGDQFDA